MTLLERIKGWFSVEPADSGYTVPKYEVTALNEAGEVVKPKPVYVPVNPIYFRHEIEQIRFMANKLGWEEIALQEPNKLISFAKDDTRINIYYSTMTVGTCLNHPKLGKTQLFRRNVSMRLLEIIFNNPRVHTTCGYRQKHD